MAAVLIDRFREVLAMAVRVQRAFATRVCMHCGQHYTPAAHAADSCCERCSSHHDPDPLAGFDLRCGD